MRWGVRRYQNKDGSLTSEGKQRNKIRDDDVVIKRGTVSGHVTDAKKIRFNTSVNPLYLYNANDPYDQHVYKGPYSKFIREYKSNGIKQVYEHKYLTNEDLISPSEKHRKEIFKQMYRKHPEEFKKDLKDVEDKLKWMRDNYGSDDGTSIIGKIDWSNAVKVTDKQLENHAYQMYQRVAGQQNAMTAHVFSEVMSRGYNAIIDDNNQGIYNDAVQPYIALYAGTSLRELGKARKVPPQEIERSVSIVRDHMRRKTGSDRIKLSMDEGFSFAIGGRRNQNGTDG